MRRELALRVLGDILGWDDARATNEFHWLNLMSRLKFDGYQDFLAGVRFIESLATWVQQFQSVDEREVAYSFVRNCLIYVGEAEMQHLVEIFYPEFVERRLVQAVAHQHAIPPYRVWGSEETAAAYDQLLRKTLFIGLSEGARLDLLRRVNAGTISHEQILQTIYVDDEKWQSVLADLRSDLDDDRARFRFLYLVDDFTASGTTFLRKKGDQWGGKLGRLWDRVRSYLETHFDEGLTVCVHHHLASAFARDELARREADARKEKGDQWFSSVEFTFGTVLPESTPLTRSDSPIAGPFLDLARKYCDREDRLLRNKHFEEGNTKDPALGFSDCALPLVLEHNTPNNSLALLWAETPGDPSSETPRPAMRALFRRRQRHM